jgi:hypothetical protein
MLPWKFVAESESDEHIVIVVNVHIADAHVAIDKFDESFS